MPLLCLWVERWGLVCPAGVTWARCLRNVLECPGPLCASVSVPSVLLFCPVSSCAALGLCVRWLLVVRVGKRLSSTVDS